MSVFTKEDVDAMTGGGNDIHNAKYLARHTARDHPIPDGHDIQKLRDFIKMKYVDKRWYSDQRSLNSEAKTLPNNEISTAKVQNATSETMFDPFGNDFSVKPVASTR